MTTPPTSPRPTLAERLIYLPTRAKRLELEQFLRVYEFEHKRVTQFTDRFTSTLPTRQQQWLFDHEREVWVRGLPEFAKEFFRAKYREAVETDGFDGNLCDFVSSYMGGHIRAPRTPEQGR